MANGPIAERQPVSYELLTTGPSNRERRYYSLVPAFDTRENPTGFKLVSLDSSLSELHAHHVAELGEGDIHDMVPTLMGLNPNVVPNSYDAKDIGAGINGGQMRISIGGRGMDVKEGALRTHINSLDILVANDPIDGQVRTYDIKVNAGPLGAASGIVHGRLSALYGDHNIRGELQHTLTQLGISQQEAAGATFSIVGNTIRVTI